MTISSSAMAEEAGGALLALGVELLDDAEDVRAGEVDRALARRMSLPRGLGDEHALPEVPHILGKDPARDTRGAGTAGDEEVHVRIVEVHGPAAGLVLGTGGEVQREGGEGLLEHGVVLVGVLQVVIGAMQIVVDVERLEVGPGDERVAPAHEIGADFEG